MWNGHYWVEGKTPGGVGFVADITADQFGWPNAVVLPMYQARERYRAGDDEIVAEAVDDLEAQITAEARLAIRCLDD